MADVNTDVASSMGKKVGPLPLGGWIAVLGAGLLVGLYLKNKNAASAAAAASQQQAQVQQGLPDVGVGPGDVSGSSGASNSTSGDGSSVGPTTAQTNQQWEVMVANKLIAQGYDPNLVDSALRDYLAANNLTAQENAVIHVALMLYGVPPEPLPPAQPPSTTSGSGSSNSQPPPPPPPTPPPAPPPPPPVQPSPPPAPPPQRQAPAWDDSQSYTAHTGDTYSGVAAQFGMNWQDLWNYQFLPGIRSPAAVMALRSRGPNNALFNGSDIEIPPKGVLYQGGYNW